MAISTVICLTLTLYGLTQGFQQAFRSGPSLFQQPIGGITLNSPGAEFVKIISFSIPPERSNVGGYGFSNPPEAVGAGTDPAARTCGLTPEFCTNSRYRSIDGSCNNLQRPSWGMPQTPYGRLTPYNYADGISVMTRSVTGRQLPNARELSMQLFLDKNLVDPVWNLNAQQWGQIITHDMSLTAGAPQIGGAPPLVCCDNRGQLAPDVNNPSCAPILFPSNDPIHAPEGVRCQNFVRTGTTRDRGCTAPTASAEPISVVTAFMDLSIVYGSSALQAAPLRARTGGRLLTLFRNNQEWPPQDSNVTLACPPAQSSNEPCYLAGDIRVNQNPQLTVLQVILLREHNRIADVLGHLNPHWNDETLFQEARRIHIAEMQHINYYEYLPILLGFENMVQNKLIYPEAYEYVNDYNAGVDPSILDEHATAAFRHFHTLIRGYLKLVTESRQLAGTIRLSDWLNRPLVLEIGDSFSKLARGLTAQEMDFSDQFWDAELTQFFFKGNNTFGGDLRATDIQRGRDHGLGSYVTTRAACELPIPNSFHDMLDYISKKNVAVLQSMYASHQDVDLVVGGSLERNVPGAMVGPTFLCILTEQFYRTRVGDRYFYENGGDPNIAFTPGQLNAIRQGANMARILCDNVDSIHLMQPKAFRLVSINNEIVPCDQLPFVDLSLWQDVRGQGKK
ncbi:unnamed protein product [Arctia plantaginis]|uniref:Peroxidase n=1 Tax=Arctia plantaginis TaxID=874455 RepID=A0A8S0ZSA8_ARCPL|nr:unnamed protein product [Arctia plantaginis]